MAAPQSGGRNTAAGRGTRVDCGETRRGDRLAARRSHERVTDSTPLELPAATTGTIERVSAERGRGVVSLEIAWRMALEQLASAGISDQHLADISKASSSPAIAMRLAELVANDHSPRTGSAPEAEPAGFQRLVQVSEESPCPWKDWLLALSELLMWLEQQGRTTDLSTALGFLCCTQDAIDSGRQIGPLPAATSDYLQMHGYRG